jgi:hypothetical protein
MPWTGVQRLCALADHGIFDENNRFTENRIKEILSHPVREKAKIG